MVLILATILLLYYLLCIFLQNEIVIQIKRCNRQELNIASIENFDQPPPEYTPEYLPDYHPELPPPYSLHPNTCDEPETILQWNNPKGSNQTQLLSTTCYGYI